MAPKTLIDRLAHAGGRSAPPKAATSSITFALAIVPIIGFVGAAVDYSRANSAKAAMQAAIDSTALMLSKDAQTLTTAQLNQKADGLLQGPVQPHRRHQHHHHADLHHPGGGQLPARCDRHRHGRHQLHEGVRTAELEHQRQLGGALGHQEARARARARQYRLDVLEQQDDGAQEGRPHLAGYAEEGRRRRPATSRSRSSRSTPRSISARPTRTSRGSTSTASTATAAQSGTGCTSSNWKNYWEGCVRDRTYPYDTQDTAPTTADNAVPGLRLRLARQDHCR